VTKYKRKIIVFVAALVVAIASSFFMAIDFYKEFLYFLMVVSTGFFASNGIEHISKIKRGNKDNGDTG